MKKQELDIEIKVIERFILKDKRDRYLTFIKKFETRKKFIKDLSHFNFLNGELFEKVEVNDHDTVLTRIAMLGDIRDCYVISENQKVDCRRLDTGIALKEIIGADMGTLLVFGDAQIVYSEAEGFNNRWISKQL